MNATISLVDELKTNLNTKASLTDNNVFSGSNTFNKVEATTLNATNLTKGNKSVALAEDVDTLKKSVDSNWDLICKNMGVGKYANQQFLFWSWVQDKRYISDSMLPYYSNCSRMFQNMSFSGTQDLIIANDFRTNANLNFLFLRCTAGYKLYLSNYNYTKGINWGYDMSAMFKDTTFTHILIKDDCSFKLGGVCYMLFQGSSNLVEIGAFDCSQVISFDLAFNDCTSLKSIHMTHISAHLNIAASTQFETDDLVEIISNLNTVTTTRTLTMGATNLAKLSDEQKQVATDKGWVLA